MNREATGLAGVRHIVYETLGSTNAEALALAGAGERGPLWLTATSQSAGRGRRGSHWVSQPGNLLVYMSIYVVMTLCTFAVILSMRRAGRLVENIGDLSGLARTHPNMAFFLAVLLFSLAGVPPLAGFFGKFYVFLAAI